MIDAALLVEQVAKALAALRHENPDMLDMLVDVYNIPAWQAKYGADARAAVALVLRAVAGYIDKQAREEREGGFYEVAEALAVEASELRKAAAAATAVEGQK